MSLSPTAIARAFNKLPVFKLFEFEDCALFIEFAFPFEEKKRTKR